MYTMKDVVKTEPASYAQSFHTHGPLAGTPVSSYPATMVTFSNGEKCLSLTENAEYAKRDAVEWMNAIIRAKSEDAAATPKQKAPPC